MYKIIYLLGFIIRQLLLPNPFAPLGTSAELINYIVGGAFIPLSYFMTGFIYEKGSEPSLGSILYTAVYAVNTGITYLVCFAYPTIWLMIVIVVIYLAIFVLAAYKIRGY